MALLPAQTAACATHQPKLQNAGESIIRTLSTIQKIKLEPFNRFDVITRKYNKIQMFRRRWPSAVVSRSLQFSYFDAARRAHKIASIGLLLVYGPIFQ